MELVPPGNRRGAKIMTNSLPPLSRDQRKIDADQLNLPVAL
jgi:hypothetical protein